MSRILHSAVGAVTRDQDQYSSRHRECVMRDRRIERNYTVYLAMGFTGATATMQAWLGQFSLIRCDEAHRMFGWWFKREPMGRNHSLEQPSVPGVEGIILGRPNFVRVRYGGSLIVEVRDNSRYSSLFRVRGKSVSFQCAIFPFKCSTLWHLS
jgi:hypothetical protein